MIIDPEILNRLYKYCAYQDRCRSEIETKMREYELPADYWENVLIHLQEERFWDEERFARSYVRGKFRIKRWGKQKIKNGLYQKKVDKQLIELALREEIDPEAYEATLDKIATRKERELTKGSEKERQQKLIRFLQQRGFEWELIRPRVGLVVTLLCLCSLVWVRCTSPSQPQYASLNPRTQYVGMENCQSCHANTYKSYQQTGMGHSLYPPVPAEAIERFGPEEVVYDAEKDFYYQAYWQDDELFVREFRLRETDTVHQRREQVNFIVGSGHQTRSYLMERNGYWYEMPITWYVEKQIWDLSPGYEVNNSRFSREIGQECLSCHTGNNEYLTGSKNRFAQVAHGIGCEKCHGPGSTHISLAKQNQLTDEGTEYSIVNPADLSIDRQFDICQQCHLQGVNVYRPGKSIADFRPGMALTEVMDVFIERQENENAFGIASHAERLKASQCFVQSAGKLTCTTCHNPHKSISVTDPKRYTRQCTNCHQPQKSPECSASNAVRMAEQDNCINCHMPQGGTRDIPHVSFHDHKIRVVRPTDTVEVAAIKDFLKLQLATREKAPDSVWGQAWLLYYERHNQQNEYLQQAQQQLAQGPTYPKAQAAFYAGDDRLALQTIQQHLQTDSLDAFAHYLHGEILEAQGGFLAAYQAYDHAYRLQPESVEAGLKSVVMRIRGSEGNPVVLAEVTGSLKQLYERKPFDKRILLNYAFVLLNQGQKSKAKDLLQTALQLDPDYTIARQNLELL